MVDRLEQMKTAVQRTVQSSFEVIGRQLTPGSRLGIKDMRLHIATSIIQSYCLWREDREELQRTAEWEGKNGSPELALQAVEYARELGAVVHEGLVTEAEAKRDQGICALYDLISVTGQTEAVELAEAQARLGKTAVRLTEQLHRLEEAWKLLQMHNTQHPEISLSYGKSLSASGKFTEAENVMRQGLKGQGVSPAAAALSNGISEIRYALGNWDDVATMCQWTLTTFAKSSCQFQLVHAAYMWVGAVRSKGGVVEGMEKWMDFAGDSECEAVRMCLAGDIRKDKETYTLGVEQCQRLLPPSFLTANCMHRLADQLPDIPAEQMYWRAMQVYSKHSPCSVPYAQCLSSLGDRYQLQHRLEEAEKVYSQALHILATYHPDSLPYLHCLTRFGLLHSKQHKADQTEAMLQRAIKLCSSSYPNSLIYAECSAGLGRFYISHAYYNAGIESYLKACQLYFILSPASESHLDCVLTLGNAYLQVRKYSEARDKFAQATEILAETDYASSRHKEAICKLAAALTALQKWTEAEEQYFSVIGLAGRESFEEASYRQLLGQMYLQWQQTIKAEEQMKLACSIYMSDQTQLSSLDFLVTMGLFYKQLKNPIAAEKWLTTARPLYQSQHPDTDNFRVCLANLALLYKQIDRKDEADALLLLAQTSHIPPLDSPTACLMWLGSLCSHRHQTASAEELWLWGVEVCSDAGSLSLAQCFQALGQLYQDSNQSEQAETQYLQALGVYQNLPMTAEHPHCLVSLGKLYAQEGLKDAALVQVEKAKALFREMKMGGEVSNCEYVQRKLKG